jgi:hypothetical protein
MWFNNAVVTMSVLGLLSGTPDGLFHPKKGASRAEAATLIWKMLSVERKDFTAERMKLEPAMEPR